METTNHSLPKPFFWRRLHSLTGIWLTAFLMIHLLTNSQASLLIGDDAHGFVKAVNDIRELPYIPIIELILIALPFIIHGIWGIKYLLTGETNSFVGDGTKPNLPEYPRNQAYTWQRVTSWALLFLIAFHVIHMRFLEYPARASIGTDAFYMVRITNDPGLNTLSARLGFKTYNKSEILQQKESLPKQPSEEEALALQKYQQEQHWYNTLNAYALRDDDVVAVSPNFGTAELLMVRDSFKNPLLSIVYTILVLFACFHGFNGLWTFMITWGITLSPSSQRRMRQISTFLMLLFSFLGLAAIWGTYWINLRH